MGQWVGLATKEAVLARQTQQSEFAQKNGHDMIPLQPPDPIPLYMFQKAIVYWTAIVGVYIAVVAHMAVNGWAMSWPGRSNERWLADGMWPDSWEAELLLGLFFAPMGAWLRFILSKYNPIFPTFPAFTLLANIIGTGISAACWVIGNEIAHSRRSSPKAVAPCHVLLDPQTWVSAIGSAFCGCLSTASTFVNELDKLASDPETEKPSTSALVYAVSSIGCAQLLLCGIVNCYLALAPGPV